MSEDLYEKCADAVARYIRGLSVTEYNEYNNLKEALSILDLSMSVARGHELCQQLQEDKAKLLNIQEETLKQNLRNADDGKDQRDRRIKTFRLPTKWPLLREYYSHIFQTSKSFPA